MIGGIKDRHSWRANILFILLSSSLLCPACKPKKKAEMFPGWLRLNCRPTNLIGLSTLGLARLSMISPSSLFAALETLDFEFLCTIRSNSHLWSINMLTGQWSIVINKSAFERCAKQYPLLDELDWAGLHKEGRSSTSCSLSKVGFLPLN